MRVSPLIIAQLLAAAALPAQDSVLALRGATVHTATGQTIRNATVLVRGGKIAAVGSGVAVPAGARIVDVSGKEMIPGLVDNHSHIGFPIQDANESPQSFVPQIRALDMLNPDDPRFRQALSGGVTTIVTGTGSGEVSSGEAVVLKTFGPSLDARILRAEGGIKFAMGRKNPARPPSTSPAVTAALRQHFIRTREYVDARRRWEEGGRQGAPPARDLMLEAFAKVLSRESDARVHVHTAHDIMAILRLKDEFGFDLTIHHATEAYKLAEEIARRNVNVVGMPLGMRIGAPEDVVREGMTLSQAGVRFAFHTDDPVIGGKWQRLNGSIGVRYGMTEENALRALTRNGAEIARVGDRVGTIEAGKDADLVILNGPWYELKTRVDMVYVNGVLAYDRSTEEK
jgi:imidazolonepropionase-like amidohydrolase